MTNDVSTGARNQRLPRSARRALLLEAALAAFAENGYHQAAMDDIADRAGVSKPVLYQHFPGKLELYLAVLDAECTVLESAVAAALRSTDDNKERVARTVQAYFTYVGREGAPFRLVFESDLADQPEVAARLDKVTTTCAQALAEVIADDTDLGEPECLFLGMALSGMAQIAARYWLSSGRDIPESEATQLVGQLGWRGIRAFPMSERGPASHDGHDDLDGHDVRK